MRYTIFVQYPIFIFRQKKKVQLPVVLLQTGFIVVG